MNKEIQYLLDKTISRIDTYITSVNTKAAFIVTFNTFILGAIIVNFDSIIGMPKLKPYPLLVIILLFVIAFSSAVSIGYVFRAVSPFLKLGNVDGQYSSLFFFGSIAKMPLEEYRNKVLSSNEEAIFDDMIRQNHILSTAASVKFDLLSKSIFYLVYLVLIPISLIMVIIGIDSLMQHWGYIFTC